MKRIFRLIRMPLFFLLLAGSVPARAGYFEISAGFSFSRSNYAAQSFSWSRRLGGSIGYHFTELSELEYGYQYSTERTKINGFQDTTTNDQVMSVNWVQSLLKRTAIFQPYVKGGIGQLNRKATGSYVTGDSPPARLDSLTVILGAGARIRLSETVGIRAEFTSYLTGGSIRSWKDNVGYTVGLSFLF